MSKKSESLNNAAANIISELTQQPQQPAPDPAAPAPKMSKAAKTSSVYMSADQHAAIERIARELETNKHNVMQIAIRHFIEDYDSGKYKPQALYKKVYY